MSYDIRAFAPAKINIGLRVLPVQEDGYHGIESIFQKVPFYDTLKIKCVDKNKTGCSVICKGMDLPEQNTITAAYDAFCRVAGVSGAISVELEKQIPAGAGLGGGSSDAATLVLALEQLFGVALSQQEKKQIASLVGSDVFFFLDSEAIRTGCALVTGRGEFVQAIPSRKDLFFVMLCPDVHSSTKEAYALVDEWNKYGWIWRGPELQNLQLMYSAPVKEWRFENGFTEPLEIKYPQIRNALQDLKDADADYVQMSGSGASVYGVFDSFDKANNTFLMLHKKWKKSFIFASS